MLEVHISKHSLFRLKITVDCRLCTCPSIHFSLDEDTLKITVGCLMCGVVCVWCVVVVCCGGVLWWCVVVCCVLCVHVACVVCGLCVYMWCCVWCWWFGHCCSMCVCVFLHTHARMQLIRGRLLPGVCATLHLSS